MNSRLLFAATVAISVISSLAMADEPQLTPAQVDADLRQIIATHTDTHTHTVQRSDRDDATRPQRVTAVFSHNQS